ncbi:MAG: hypothetical protein ACYDAG_12125 [Chloroflexota bacterium]
MPAMDELAAAAAILGLLVILAVLSPRFGAESRYGFGEDVHLDDLPGRRPWAGQVYHWKGYVKRPD